MRLAITGASGYIGRQLVEGALRAGHEVLALSRHPINDDRVEWLAFDLQRASCPTLRDVDAVIHLAAVTTHKPTDSDIEPAAAASLLMSSKRAGARFVFVSSQTAREDAPTEYGRIKWRIEQDVLAQGGAVVRPGQVYGGPERALFGILVASMRRLPCTPTFLPAPTVQPVHVDDLANALIAVARRDDLRAKVLHIGAPKPISFTHFLQQIAHHRLHRWRPRIPIPTFGIRLAAAVLGPSWAVRLGLPRLLSLFDLPPMETADDLAKLELTLRPLATGMEKSNRHGLILEAKTLLTYVLGGPPGSQLVRRMVRCVESLRLGQALRLPGFALWAPSSVALLDSALTKTGSSGPELSWRLGAAVLLAEATPQGAARFLGGSPHASIAGGTLLPALWRMTSAVVVEAGWRLAGLLLRPVLAASLRRSGLI